jgi:hypothetical protein
VRPLLLAILLATSLGTMLSAQSAPADQLRKPFVVKNAVPTGLTHANATVQSRIVEKYGQLPLSFEANRGQANGQVKFLSHTGSYSLFLTDDESVLAFSAKKSRSVLRMKLRHANSASKVTGMDELAGTSNYFIGNDPEKWHSKVPTYAKVKYEAVYPGIDLVYYGNQRQLEYDFIVAPGADPHRIGFDVTGAKRFRTDARGDLLLKVNDGEIRWHKPVVYQEKNGVRQEIAAHYAISATNRVAFDVAKYDASQLLYIDPLIYSTYLGGSGDDQGDGIAVDTEGNTYITGSTKSTDFPTVDPLQPIGGGAHYDAFVTKIDPSGSAIVYSTYLGGSQNEFGSSIAVDSAGSAYVIGDTFSSDFPIAGNALQRVCNRGSNCAVWGDAFVAKLSADGSVLSYSTFLGGSADEHGRDIAVDNSGNVYVTGDTDSTDFPTKHPLQPTNAGSPNVFVAKINSSGSALIYSTYLGGTVDDEGWAIAVDRRGDAYITGVSLSPDFPTTNALQPKFGGTIDAFVAKISATGTTLVYSTYLGGSEQDQALGIAVDGEGNAFVTGFTASIDFPTNKPLQAANDGGDSDAFVAKLNPQGSGLVYSTYLGGTGSDYGVHVAVDSSGNAYVTGGTSSTDFPTINPLQAANAGGTDVFISELNPTGSTLRFSTYLGGSGSDSPSRSTIDNVGNLYVTGETNSTDFPTMNPLQAAYAGANDGFVVKIFIAAPTTTTLSSSLNPSTYGQAVSFTASVTSGIGAPPDGETVTFTIGTTVAGTATLLGGTASFVTSALPGGKDFMKAAYTGDSKYGASTSGFVKQIVDQATTTTTLLSSENPSNFGQSVTFTASVIPQFGGPVSGKVSFYDGATLLKTVWSHGGAAELTISKLASGIHTITARYDGNSSSSGSSGSLTQIVN